VYEPLSLLLESFVQGLQADSTAGLTKQDQCIGVLLARVAGHCIGVIRLPFFN